MSAVGPGAFSMIWLQVLAEAVVGHPALDGHAGGRTFWKTYVLFGFV